MLGAEVILRTSVGSGVEVCFVNPGTTELPLVAALESVAGLRPVLGLAEGVLAGAADGYARMTGKPALVVVHQGPSLGNAVANLHNARRARSPVVVLVGEQPTWHRPFDPPLSCDVEALAGVVSGWTRACSSAAAIGEDMASAIAAASGPPGQVASLIVPADVQWGEAGAPAAPKPKSAWSMPSSSAVGEARAALRRGRAALLLGGSALSEAGLREAARVAEATSARLFCESFPARLERGVGLPQVTRVPYASELAAVAFADVQAVVLAGASEPVSFFGYQGVPSRLLPASTAVVSLASPVEDATAGLAALAADLGAPPFSAPSAAAQPRPTGALTPRTLAAAVAHLVPDGAIVVDEGVSVAGSLLPVSAGSPRHAYLSLTGGACGQGLPCAAGAAIAAPGRRVVALVGDGSALYAPQALWTQAREGLDVVNVICANDAYRILQVELTKLLGATPGPRAAALTCLAPPSIDWGAIARGFGLPAWRAGTAEELLVALGRALATAGPSLVEVRL